jgi:hypothetical protein
MKISRVSILFVLTSVLILSFSPGKKADNKVSANIKWKSTEHDFGRIVKNKPVTAVFEFNNPSMVPLIINKVEPQCGCTVANYPKEPIKPGKSAKISVSYNAKNIGYFKKSVIVSSNAEDAVTNLIIKGEVVDSLE